VTRAFCSRFIYVSAVPKCQTECQRLSLVTEWLIAHLYLKDSASKVGFRFNAFLIALLGQLACDKTQKLQSHDLTAYVIADDCVLRDLYLCVRDQCSRTVATVKTKLHLMLRPYYILTGVLYTIMRMAITQNCMSTWNTGLSKKRHTLFRTRFNSIKYRPIFKLISLSELGENL